MNLQELNFRPDDGTVGPTYSPNALTFALQTLAPPRVSSRMLEGLRQDTKQPDLTQQPGVPQAFESMTNEQLAALALRPILPRQ
jgi:hypothetical protein